MSNNKTPVEIVNELSEMVLEMEQKGMLHENHWIQIEEMMAAIYKEENLACNLANDLMDPEDDEYCPTNSPYMLIEYVENKEQFAQDFKNVVHQTIHSDRYISDFDNAIEDIIAQRRI